MKKQLLTIALAAVAITGAKALPTYNDGDVFLAIRNTAQSFSYVLDLGSMDAFVNWSNGGKSSPLNLNTVGGFTAAALQTDLNNQIGGSWYTTSTVVFGLFGGYQAGNSSSTISNFPDNAILIGKPSSYGSAAWGNIADQTISTLTGYAAGMGDNIGGTAVLQVGNAWISANGGTGAWDTYQYGGTPTTYNVQGSSAYGVYPGTLETQVALGQNVNTVYSSVAAYNNGFAGANIGQLTVSATGDVTLQAAPEPSTYALCGVGALLLFVAYRRRAQA